MKVGEGRGWLVELDSKDEEIKSSTDHTINPASSSTELPFLELSKI
jgi:hypothetical protein